MAAFRSAAAKAVHLKVFPRPTSLSESRELLNVLQQFGEVTMFKSLRLDYLQPAPNTCLAIYRDATSAASLLKASPLRFTLEPVVGNDDAGEPHDQTPQSAREDATASTLDSDLDPEVADVMGDAQFSIKEGRGKPGAEEMLRPSTLLYQTIDAFSHPVKTAQSATAQDTASSDVSGVAQSDAGSASPDAELVERPEHDYAGQRQQQPGPTSAPKHVPAPQPPRVFHVVADISEMNHRDYIERSMWYGPYNPRKRTLSYMDLTARGVPSNIADVWSKKPEQPMRVVQELREKASSAPTLREIWKQGQKQRA
ncbi:pal1-like protein [Diplodia corticola]|uniref:Pal1-like protein n=1 Tax=Diplodia corticola TaxID=236234 RepID=A0A1J9RM04_9PEZI|nr:pal1-like protein [Diplodia corticola]OJD28956.1 pal1-like protein [Diplodia corticola]